MWRAAQNRKGNKHLMLILRLNEAMANSVRWYGHVSRRVDTYVLIRALGLEVEGQRKKQRQKRTWTKQVSHWSLSLQHHLMVT